MRPLIFSLRSPPDWLLIKPNNGSALARAASDRNSGSGLVGPRAGSVLGRLGGTWDGDFGGSRRAIRGRLPESLIVVFVVRLLIRSLLTNSFVDDLCIIFQR